jgi:lysophospholipase
MLPILLVQPLIVYIPNGPYITCSNVATFDLSHDNTQRNLIIENGHDVATLGNGTFDDQWPTCIACAVLSRRFYKTGTAVPSDCSSCFARYCWDGTRDSTTPSGDYEPGYKLGDATMASGGSKASSLRFGSAPTMVTIAIGWFLSM